MDAVDTGSPICIPVGRPTLGRMLDVTGKPIDEQGEIVSEETLPIHRPAPAFEDLEPSTEILETGIRSWICLRLIPKAVRLACSAAPAWQNSSYYGIDP